MVPPNSPSEERNCSPSNNQSENLHPSTVFHLLENNHRRYLLHYFYINNKCTADIDEVCEFVIEEPPDGPAEKATFKTELQHVHLPKLESFSVIDYDDRHTTIRYYEDPLVERCLELVSAHDVE